MTTRRDILWLLLVPPAALLGSPSTAAGTTKPSLKGDVIATAGGDVILHPVNHASLVIGFKDAVIYVDPVGGRTRYQGLPRPTAILVTHDHPDHLDVPTLEAIGATQIAITAPQAVIDALPDDLKRGAKAAANGDSGTISGVPFTAMPAYNTTPGRLDYHPKGVGNGYVLHFADKTIYIAGDTEDIPEMRALTGIDVAFVPMNLPYTMTEAQAADAVKAFKPKIVYPYHYKGSDVKLFAKLVGDAADVRLVDWYAE
jgi:L-ascorbate metabolism protein UlaG (beta-lactamase superfamily)